MIKDTCTSEGTRELIEGLTKFYDGKATFWAVPEVTSKKRDGTVVTHVWGVRSNLHNGLPPQQG